MKTNTSFSGTRLDLRLAAYAATGAAVATAAAAPSARAAVVYSGPVAITVPNNLNGVYLDLVTGVASTSSFTGYDFNPYAASAGLTFYAGLGDGVVGTAATGASELTPGVSVVSSASTFLTGVVPATAFRDSSSFEFAGISFTNDTTGVTNYGWVELVTTAGTGFPATIVGYGYENTGAGITAGQIASVPEPGTNAALAIGALSLGAVGVRRWRNGKQAVA